MRLTPCPSCRLPPPPTHPHTHTPTHQFLSVLSVKTPVVTVIRALRPRTTISVGAGGGTADAEMGMAAGAGGQAAGRQLVGT